jgi:2-polyprenyl-6-methoxyphenol hydroxylase-like FAD-dependent oxidoreductase
MCGLTHGEYHPLFVTRYSANSKFNGLLGSFFSFILVVGTSAPTICNLVLFSHECIGFVQDAEGVTTRFKNGEVVRGDVLIGADGLRSVVRAQLFGDGPPRYAGYTAWRAIARIATSRIVPCESWGRGQRFGIVPMGDGRVYWYATKNSAEGGLDLEGQAKRNLSQLFRGWHDPIGPMIEATDESAILRNDIYDREPRLRWSENRLTLLGMRRTR